MVSVFRYEDIAHYQLTTMKQFVMDFYCIAIKKDFKGKIKYGQHYYDYDEGVMAFISPHQLLSHIQDSEIPIKGVCLLIHLDFLAGYPLGKKIKDYGFFSYGLNEALHLSEREEGTLDTIFREIKKESESNLDRFTQDVIIAQIELLLQYSNRFYNRQFITRKVAHDEILIRLEDLLEDYFRGEGNRDKGLPTVQYVADRLSFSPDYLSDMLRAITGKTTQEHIHDKIIHEAKKLLSTTSENIGQIAYRLGFEYPSSLNKLFKHKTNVTPSEFRKKFV
ncbi:helix-turn-helix transcriptional regulator [Flavobacterium rakeshii]|uniref:helix-turn-helix domain-containing protein n=1 Tax=Flavobacterium rakeshii TaxID=1038845 RepID=UPI002E7ADCA8|nr:helix-turn-helix transcriptional regulator [Flavobacterium rakeshii]MEE1900071.1 helix-turn-helix transcriptional regulator [Flavobacterium rakeshii]